MASPQTGDWRTVVQKFDGQQWVTQEEVSGDHLCQLRNMHAEIRARNEKIRREVHALADRLHHIG